MSRLVKLWLPPCHLTVAEIAMHLTSAAGVLGIDIDRIDVEAVPPERVFLEDRKWYCWNEARTDIRGPFASYQLASAAAKEFA